MTIDEGLKIQVTHLNEWRSVLNPETFQFLSDEVTNKTITVLKTGTCNGFDIPRGNDLTEIVLKRKRLNIVYERSLKKSKRLELDPIVAHRILHNIRQYATYCWFLDVGAESELYSQLSRDLHIIIMDQCKKCGLPIHKDDDDFLIVENILMDHLKEQGK